MRTIHARSCKHYTKMSLVIISNCQNVISSLALQACYTTSNPSALIFTSTLLQIGNLESTCKYKISPYDNRQVQHILGSNTYYFKWWEEKNHKLTCTQFLLSTDPYYTIFVRRSLKYYSNISMAASANITERKYTVKNL